VIQAVQDQPDGTDPAEPTSPGPAAEPGRPQGRARFGRLAARIDYTLIFLGLISLIFAKHRITADGRRRFDALTQLLSGDGFSPDRYPLIGPLFASPMWWLGRVAGGPELWLRYYNLVLFSLGLLALFLVLRNRVDAELLRRFLLLLVAATMIPAHVPDFYGETFTAVTVALGVILAVGIVTHPAIRAMGWVVVILGVANTPANLPGLGLVTAERGIAKRRLRYALPAVAALALVLIEAWLRRGSPTDQGYINEYFNFPFFLGILAILFSFGKGLVFFLPGLCLPIRRRIRDLYDSTRIDLWAVYRSWMLYVAGLVLAYASWWAWSGDLYFGPRFFLVAIFPASLALAVWLVRPGTGVLPNLALLGVLALSVWVAADASVFETMGAPRCYTPILIEDLCRFGVQESDLWYPLQAWPADLHPGRWVQLIFFALVFVWLAGPIVRRLATAATASVRAHPALRVSTWRW
jgi:hypothetical protein